MDAETLNIFPSQPMHVEPSPKVSHNFIALVLVLMFATLFNILVVVM